MDTLVRWKEYSSNAPALPCDCLSRMVAYFCLFIFKKRHYFEIYIVTEMMQCKRQCWKKENVKLTSPAKPLLSLFGTHRQYRDRQKPANGTRCTTLTTDTRYLYIHYHKDTITHGMWCFETRRLFRLEDFFNPHPLILDIFQSKILSQCCLPIPQQWAFPWSPTLIPIKLNFFVNCPPPLPQIQTARYFDSFNLLWRMPLPLPS